MVGSEDSIGSPNTTLNAIVAEAFCEAADRLEGAEDFDMAVHDLIKEYMTEHQRIIFNGNGYAREWEEEAARRGLPNIPSMVAAVDTLTTPKAICSNEIQQVAGRCCYCYYGSWRRHLRAYPYVAADHTEADRDGKGIRGTSRGGEKGFRHGERQGAGILLSR